MIIFSIFPPLNNTLINMEFLRIYAIGVLVCFLMTLLSEHLYFGNGRSETVHLKTIGEDFLYSLLSWIGVLGGIFMFMAEAYTGFPEKGTGEFLHDYEEELKEEKEKDK